MGKRKNQQKKQVSQRESLSIESLFRSLQHSEDFCSAIRDCATIGDQISVAFQVFKCGWPGNAYPHYTEVFRMLMAWCNDTATWPTLQPHFQQLLADRKRRLHGIRSRKRSTVLLGHLNPQAFNKALFLESLPCHSCTHLPAGQEYPVRNLFIAESDDIFARNTSFIFRSTVSDCRISRKFVQRLQVSKLKHDVKESDSGLYYDGDKLVLAVIRDACPAPDLVTFMDGAISDIISTRNHIRKEDPGHLSQMGMSAGSRSAGCLDWVKNIRIRSRSVAEHFKNDYNASVAFAILWNLCKTILPDEIVHDIEVFMASLGPDLRMDGHGFMPTDGAGKGEYCVPVGGEWWKFTNSNLAPPAGVMASNYARHVHREVQPHAWAVALTTSRCFEECATSESAGGHFFLASYGIRVCARANTLVAWKPEHWHATSLALVNPTDKLKEYHQRGLAFVTSNRLPGAVRKYRLGLISAEEMDDLIFSHHEDDLEDGEKEVAEYVSAVRRSARLAVKAVHALAN